MNALLYLTFLAVVCLSEAMTTEYKAKLITSLAECMKKYKLTKDEVIAIVKADKIPEDKEKQCVAGCALDKLGYIKDLTMNWDAFKKANPDKFNKPEDVEKANQVADNCAKTVSEKEGSLCELGVKAITCIYEEAEKLQLSRPDFNF